MALLPGAGASTPAPPVKYQHQQRRVASPAVSPPQDAGDEDDPWTPRPSSNGARATPTATIPAHRPAQWRQWPSPEDVRALVRGNASLRARQAEELAGEAELAAPLAPAWPTELDRLRRHCAAAEQAVSAAERHMDAEAAAWKQQQVAHREECAAIRTAAARREEALLSRVAELERSRSLGECAIRRDVAEFSVRAAGVIRSLRQRVAQLESEGAAGGGGDDHEVDSVEALQQELELRSSSRSANFSRAVSGAGLTGAGGTGEGADGKLHRFFRSIDGSGDSPSAFSDGAVGDEPISSVTAGSTESIASSFERRAAGGNITAHLDAVVSQREADIQAMQSDEVLTLERKRIALCAEEERLNAMEEDLRLEADFSGAAAVPSVAAAVTEVDHLRSKLEELHDLRQSSASLDESVEMQEDELAVLRREQAETRADLQWCVNALRERG